MSSQKDTIFDKLAGLIPDKWIETPRPAGALPEDDFAICILTYPPAELGVRKNTKAMLFLTDDVINGDYACVVRGKDTLVGKVRFNSRYLHVGKHRFTRTRVSVVGRIVGLFGRGYKFIPPAVPLRPVHDAVTSAPPRPMLDAEITELRERLDGLEHLPENEGVRFQLETEIYQLEHETPDDDLSFFDLHDTISEGGAR